MSSTLRKTDESEIQARNGQEHQRVYDPEMHKRLGDILEAINTMNRHLEIITGEEDI